VTRRRSIPDNVAAPASETPLPALAAHAEPIGTQGIACSTPPLRNIAEPRPLFHRPVFRWARLRPSWPTRRSSPRSSLAERLDQIEAAYDLFWHQRDRVLMVEITPWLGRSDGTNENHLVCGSGGMKYELQF